MIIQELCHYYDRLRDNPDMDISEPGFSREKIHAEIVLDKNGNLLQFNDLRTQKGKKLVPKEMIVPQAFIRTASPIANFLWDNTAYVLGADNKENSEGAKKCFGVFCKFQHQLGDNVEDIGMKATLSFLDKWNSQNVSGLNNWTEIAGGNIVFRIDGDREYIHQRPVLKKAWLKYKNEKASDVKGFCLVSGQTEPIACLHPSIKGVREAQSSGAKLITFNLDAFCSYNKEQNFNAPVGEQAVFAYTTALNHLLKSDSPQKIQIGDATTVFWTERSSPVEGMLGQILDPKDTELPDNANIKQFLEAVRDSKKLPNIEEDIKFYILGLSPNNARIAVRFWHVCTVGQLEERIGRHFKDLQMIRSRDNDPEFPGIWRLLQETVNKKSNDKSPQPLLAGAVTRAILEGTAYPQSLQSAVINRIRADQEINYIRAAILKAILNRKNRIYKNLMEVTMALDKENKNTAYLLGRLFAVLEKAQKDAIPGANATIKDRFFGSASATPAAVFPQLLRLAQHHIDKTKAEYGKLRDEQIEEIVCDIKDFPAHLTLDQQGLFAIGYYHQRQSFYQKKDKE